MTVKKYKLAELTLDPNNVKRHGPRDIEAIAASLNQFGQVSPIVVNTDGVMLRENHAARMEFLSLISDR